MVMIESRRGKEAYRRKDRRHDVEEQKRREVVCEGVVRVKHPPAGVSNNLMDTSVAIPPPPNQMQAQFVCVIMMPFFSNPKNTHHFTFAPLLCRSLSTQIVVLSTTRARRLSPSDPAAVSMKL